MTRTRVLTAAVLVPVVVGIVWFAPSWVVALCTAAVILVALREFFELGERAGMPGYTRWTMLCSLALVFAQWDSTRFVSDYIGIGGMPDPIVGAPVEVVLVAFLMGTGVAVVVGRRDVRGAFGAVAVSSAGILLIALPLSFLVKLIAEAIGPAPNALLWTLVMVWVGDTTAYFVGRGFGKHLLAPTISPKKTWEGAVGNLIGTLVLAGGVGAYAQRFDVSGSMPLVHFLVLGFLVSVFGQIGDLLESAYKRSVGVKDSGALLPGHGGVLDRIDALIFAAPVVWAYITLVVP